jgi:putative endonuclease
VAGRDPSVAEERSLRMTCCPIIGVTIDPGSSIKENSMSKEYYVYIMTNKSRTLYTGVTNDLMRRVYEHKNKLIKGYTSKYNIQYLVYFESTSNVYAALQREKQIKGWLRSKKIVLIETMNPDWKDLSEEWYST